MVMRMLRTQIKWIMLSVAVIFVLSILFMYGPMRGERDDGAQKDYAVATVDGAKIMRSSIEEGLRNVLERSNSQEVSSADLPLLRKSVLENIVLAKELKKEWKARGIQIAEEEIDEVLNQIKDQFPTIEAFDQYLERAGIEMKALRENIATELGQRKVLEGELSSVVLASGDAHDFYDKTKEVFFRRPEGFNLNLAHFSNLESAHKVVDLVTAKSGWDESLAVVSSDVADHTSYDAPFFVAADALQGPFGIVASAEMNALVGPIEVGSDDYVLVIKREALPDQILPFEEVSSDIANLLLSQRRSEAQQRFFRSLLDRAEIAIHDEALFAVPESAVSEEPSASQQPQGTEEGSAEETPAEASPDTE